MFVTPGSRAGRGMPVSPRRSAAISVGYTVVAYPLGNITSFTINPKLGGLQYGTNHGASTWTAPTADGATDIIVTNDGSAGSITFSGFTVGSNVGDTLDTTNAHKFIIRVERINGVSVYTVQALQ